MPFSRLFFWREDFLPITPFHFGPGILLTALAGRQLAWTSFALANLLIDLEPILLFVTTGIPDHRFFHTWLGGSLAGLVAFWPGIHLCRWWLLFWNGRLSPGQRRWLGVEVALSPSPALAGGVLGAWSHLLLDGVMHWEVRPFWPFSSANPLAGMASVESLHLFCLVTAGVGLAGLAVRRFLRLRGAGGGRLGRD